MLVLFRNRKKNRKRREKTIKSGIFRVSNDAFLTVRSNAWMKRSHDDDLYLLFA